MYNPTSYTGANMPEKTLCLTYDDGPGIYTAEIAEFLYSQEVKATFFVVGKYASQHPEILDKLKKWNHLVANHTYDHPDLTYYQSINGDVQNQILRTDAAICNYINGNTVYFRAPYGKWSKEVSDELNINILTSLNHVGPIFWDVGGVDCYYWQKGFSVDDAVEKYITDIDEKNHGIVVMHDDIADMDDIKPKNKTLELTKKLIPILLEKGYRFMRLDEIESIKSDSTKGGKFNFKSSTGKFISLAKNIGHNLHVNGRTNNILTHIDVINLGKGKIALKAANGLYFNTNNNSQEIVLANVENINEHSSFDLIPIQSNKYMIRCSTGNFWTIGNDGNLLSREKYMKGAEVFMISPIDKPYEKKVSFKTRVSQIKRRLLYIKSKIQQG